MYAAHRYWLVEWDSAYSERFSLHQSAQALVLVLEHQGHVVTITRHEPGPTWLSRAV